MRKVVAYELMSLDGVAEDPDAYFPDWDEAMDANLARVIATQDTVILGRRSYDEWSRFWPTSDIEPFNGFINSVTKYIATSTPLDNPWTNSHVIEGPVVEFVRELKNGEGGDIGIHASISVANTLLAAGVVDELRLLVAPAIAPGGKRLLVDIPARQFELIDAESSPTGYLMLGYRSKN